jgi:predicted RNA-binding Zn ribbon-like protein
MSVILDADDIVKYCSDMSSWSATERYGLNTAPGGLELVQDFLNTRAIAQHGADLVADAAHADAWVTRAVQAWSAERGTDAHPPTLTDDDARKVRALRQTLAGLLAGEPTGGSVIGSSAAAFAISDTGEVRLEPTGRGWHWLSSALWSEVLLSQQTGTWQRLKLCRNPECAVAFYDRSKNNSGVWHNVKTCGNAANLRASRARRRAATNH